MSRIPWLHYFSIRPKAVSRILFQPVAKLVSFAPEDQGRTFAARRIVKGFSDLPATSDDSTLYLAEDRERA